MIPSDRLTALANDGSTTDRFEKSCRRVVVSS
jgi:hypothetical protein